MILSRLSSNLVLLLAAVLIVVLAWWLRTRDRRVQRALIVAAVLFGLACLYELVRPEKPGETMERKITEMSRAVPKKDLDKIFQHISEEFDMPRLNKAGLRAAAEPLIQTGELTDVKAWNFKDAKLNRGAAGERDTGTIEFTVKPHGPNIADSPGYGCVAQFVLDDDKQWRLQRFDVYPFNSTQKLQIPLVPIP